MGNGTWVNLTATARMEVPAGKLNPQSLMYNLELWIAALTGTGGTELTEIFDYTVLVMYNSELSDGWVHVYPSYGVEVLPAICEYGNDVPYTKWGVTDGELEPRGTDTCAKFCVGGTNCDGWKSTACTASLKYICQAPCEYIPG